MATATSMHGTDRFHIKRQIADTLQGRIYAAVDLITNKPVVIKEAWKQLVQRKRSRNGHRVQEDFLKERDIVMALTNLSNRTQPKPITGFAKGIHQWDGTQSYYYAMESCDVELFQYIKDIGAQHDAFIRSESAKPQIPMIAPNQWIQNVITIFAQICETVQWLHRNGYCHLDLSLENVMISDPKTLKVKIIDFGVAQKFNPNDNDFTFRKRIGKIGYMCPKAYAKKTYDARAADVWCLGVMLFMMLIGSPPFKNGPRGKDAVLKYMVSGRIREVLAHWKRLRLVTEQAMDLLDKIFKYEKDRISLEDVIRHPFLEGKASIFEPGVKTISKDISTISEVASNFLTKCGKKPPSATGLMRFSERENINLKYLEENASKSMKTILREWGLSEIAPLLTNTGWSDPNEWDQLTLAALKYEIGLSHDQAQLFIEKQNPKEAPPTISTPTKSTSTGPLMSSSIKDTPTKPQIGGVCKDKKTTKSSNIPAVDYDKDEDGDIISEHLFPNFLIISRQMTDIAKSEETKEEDHNKIMGPAFPPQPSLQPSISIESITGGIDSEKLKKLVDAPEFIPTAHQRDPTPWPGDGKDLYESKDEDGDVIQELLFPKITRNMTEIAKSEETKEEDHNKNEFKKHMHSISSSALPNLKDIVRQLTDAAASPHNIQDGDDGFGKTIYRPHRAWVNSYGAHGDGGDNNNHNGNDTQSDGSIEWTESSSDEDDNSEDDDSAVWALEQGFSDSELSDEEDEPGKKHEEEIQTESVANDDHSRSTDIDEIELKPVDIEFKKESEEEHVFDTNVHQHIDNGKDDKTYSGSNGSERVVNGNMNNERKKIVDAVEQVLNKQMDNLVSAMQKFQSFKEEFLGDADNSIQRCPAHTENNGNAHFNFNKASNRNSNDRRSPNKHDPNRYNHNYKGSNNGNGDGNDEKDEYKEECKMSAPCNHINECMECSNTVTQKYEQIKLFKSLISTLQKQHEYHTEFENMICSAMESSQSMKRSRKSRAKTSKALNPNIASPVKKASYDPTFRAKGTIKISRDLTQDIIPKIVKQPIARVYAYLDRSVGLQYNDGQLLNMSDSNKYKVVNVDLNDQNTDDALYCIIERLPQNEKTSFKWQMHNKLYSASELSSFSLPVSSRAMLINNHMNDIYRYQFNAQNVKKILKKKIKWNEMPVYKRKNNKKRITLSITKEQLHPLIKRTLLTINIQTHKLIPIVMFGADSHWIEYILMVHIQSDIDIGVSLKYNAAANEVNITGIHLNKDMISEQHELIAPHDCDCFDLYRFQINDIHVGNPDDLVNQVKDFKGRYHAMKQLIYKFVNGKDTEKYEVLQQHAQFFIKHDNGSLRLSSPSTPSTQYISTPVSPTFSSESASTQHNHVKSAYSLSESSISPSNDWNLVQ